MQITVERYQSDADATLSIIRIDGVFSCHGLENAHHIPKIAGKTRIPAGDYKVGLRTVGGFHGRYTRKFTDIHRGMLEIKDVPDFTYVLIHMGNKSKDTAGCLLVGTGAWSGGKKSIQSSTPAYRKFYRAVIDAAEAGDLRIQFIDNERVTG